MVETLIALSTLLGTLFLGSLGLIGIMWKGRNNKNGNPGVSVHLARIELFGEQTVGEIRGMRDDLKDIELVLVGMEKVIGGCQTAQQYMKRH